MTSSTAAPTAETGPAGPARRQAAVRGGWEALAVLLTALALEQWTGLDLALQRLFFDEEAARWLVDGRAKGLRWLFYSGPKAALAAVGLGLLLAACSDEAAARLRRSRLDFLRAFVVLAAAPLLAGAAKSATDVHCPCDLREFGGREPYVKVWSRYPADDPPSRRGRCFPAAHAAGGFGLLGLRILPHGRRGRRLAIGAGLAAGWVLGLYQMARGVHFFSHTVVSMALAWLLLCSIDRARAPPASSAATT